MRASSRLPRARLVSTEPSARLVRWMLYATWLCLLALGLLVLIGNHIPKS